MHSITNTEKKKQRKTLWILAAFLLVVYWFHPYSALVYFSVSLVIISLISPSLTKIIHDGWMLFSRMVGKVMNPFLLFWVYFLVLVPLALVQRLSGKNQIANRKKHASFYHKRNHLFTANDLKNMW